MSKAPKRVFGILPPDEWHNVVCSGDVISHYWGKVVYSPQYDSLRDRDDPEKNALDWGFYTKSGRTVYITNDGTEYVIDEGEK